MACQFIFIKDVEKKIQKALQKDQNIIINHFKTRYPDNKTEPTQISPNVYEMNFGDIILTMTKIDNVVDEATIRSLIKNDTKRVIIWYSGHGEVSLNFNDDFPVVALPEGKFLFQRDLTKHLLKSDFELVVTVFDCCNALSTKGPRNNLNIVKKRIELFDFIGFAMITAAKRGEVALCRDQEGSELTKNFFKRFDRNYAETIQFIKMDMDSTPVYRGKLKYLPLDKRTHRKAMDSYLKEQKGMRSMLPSFMRADDSDDDLDDLSPRKRKNEDDDDRPNKRRKVENTADVEEEDEGDEFDF